MTPQEQFEHRLDELRDLPVGWDGYNGVPVTFENVVFAWKLVQYFSGKYNVPYPQVVPGTSGDLQLEWHTVDEDVEIYIKSPYDARMTYESK